MCHRSSEVFYVGQQSFEINVIKNLAEYDKKNRKALLALTDRFADPLPIFRSYVYHPDFLGSFSIKSVAPAIIGEKLNYDNLEVGDGSTAQAWAERISRGRLPVGELGAVVANLREYCRQDTLAMVELVKWLMKGLVVRVFCIGHVVEDGFRTGASILPVQFLVTRATQSNFLER
jgi:hypothetical protein